MTEELPITKPPRRIYRYAKRVILHIVRMPAWCIAINMLMLTYTWSCVGPIVTAYTAHAHAYASVPFLQEYEVPLRELIKPNDIDYPILACSIAAAKGVSCDLVLAIIEIESVNGTQLTRFEPGLLADWDKDRKYLDRTENERRSLASSHGLMHVLGSTAEDFCSKKYSMMYDNEINLKCGIDYLLDCFKKTNDAWKAVKCYNGSGDKAVIHADRVFVALARLQNRNLIVPVTLTKKGK